MRALRTADFLYLRNFVPDRWPTGGPDFISSNKTFHGDGDGAPIKAFMEAPANQRRFPVPFALCYGKRPLEELYAVRADPHQINHLATDPAHRAAREKLCRNSALTSSKPAIRASRAAIPGRPTPTARPSVLAQPSIAP